MAFPQGVSPRSLVRLVIAVPAWCSPGGSLAGPAEDEVHAAFEWFCLSHLGRTEAIPALFEQIGVAPLPQDIAKPLVAPQEGDVWLMNGEHSRFLVSLTEEGVCSVTGPDVRAETSIELFEANIRHRRLGTERIGSQIQDVFAVTFPDPAGGPDGHAIVMLTRSNLASIAGVILNALPEQLARKEEITIPEWP
jgi:hypothetical protein